MDQKKLLTFLRETAKQQGGIKKLAQKSGLGRESLYKTLSDDGNPSLSTLLKISRALDIDYQLINNQEGS